MSFILDALESSRLERQLFGRSGRQGDPGSYDVAHALDEVELQRILGAGTRRLIAALFCVCLSGLPCPCISTMLSGAAGGWNAIGGDVAGNY